MKPVLLLALLAVAACGGEGSGTCDINGRTVAVGETVLDEAFNARCTCTAAGEYGCVDLDADAARALPARDGGRPRPDAVAPAAELPDAAAPDAAEAAPPTDAGLDAEPPDCPAEPAPIARCAAPGQICTYGDAYACCGEIWRARQTCTCADGRWDCADAYDACAAAHGAECARTSAVCARWRATLADAEDGPWDGDVAQCRAGDMTPAWRARALARVNTYRFLAGLPDVETVAASDAIAQACALALHARGGITHRLEPDEPCYTPEAARGAAGSNIHSVPAVLSVAAYIADPGEGRNFETMTHRLWLLSTNIGPIGIGSTDQFNCVYLLGGRRSDDPLWVAWPPPGPFPYDAGHADFTGWTVHSNRVNLSRATVRITVDGEERPVDFRQLRAEGGASQGVAFIPRGWASEPGVDYHVVVAGGFDRGQDVPIEYTVRMVDCGSDP